jgi:prepilin-type N-terminal cleavage/methylation domain-containing protein
MQLRRAQRGFTLTEMAVVFAIVALLIGGAMMTLSAQVEQRNNDETTRRLNAAAEAVLAFAIVNRRLPCPATAGTTGDEVIVLPGTSATGGACSTNFGGFLPARTLGVQPVDNAGYAVDAWNNRIRYAASAAAPTGCTGSSTAPHFTSVANLKANGVSCKPNDLDVCAPVDTAIVCTAANRVVSTTTVAFIVFSTGKNGANAAAYGPHETANTDNNATFISHLPSGADSLTGTFDDLMVWVPAGTLYSRLISAGVLP